MTEEESPDKKPNPSPALRQFGEELEALKQSLEASMMLFGMIHSDTSQKLKDFAKEKCDDFEENDDGFKVSVSPENLTDFKRIEKRVNSIRSSTRLLPRNFLVALLCTYDAFLGKLIRFVFELRPEILDKSERTVTYSELLEFASVDSAREHLVEKETESILRKSHVEHFDWLERNIGCSFNSGLESWPRFVELTQRRNLFVHTDGVVSSQYLKVCREHKCDIPKDRTVGTKLSVPKGYFNDSFDCLYEIGIKLTQVIWRRLSKDSLKDAGFDLIDTTISLIENRHYNVAIRVLEFFTSKDAKHDEESTRRVHIINLAQSYKWAGLEEDCKRTLERCDWSGWEDKFKLAIHVLEDDWETSFKIMKKLAHDDEYSKSSYREWPLFKGLRKAEGFKECYKECYGEDFPTQESITKPDEVEQGDEDND